MEKITFVKNSSNDDEIYSLLDPAVARWFKKEFDTFTPPQRMAIKPISEGKNMLITSPTGSGKTLTAFLYSINHLIGEIRQSKLEDRIYVLYISPLKALNNDIEKNLRMPLNEISKLYPDAAKIRIAIRSGDSTNSEKSAMLRKPPHILITTPESLGIALNAPKFSKLMEKINLIIIDEVHALAENKRGSHLSLSIERLTARISKKPQRIGLSATVHPLEDMAKFVAGMSNGRPRQCAIVDVNYLKQEDIGVISPIDDFIYTGSAEISEKLYSTLDSLISSHRTTLIFTNTRSATERVVFHLKQKFGNKYADLVSAHHSSLSRDVRADVEKKLKEGKLKAVVTSTSLELGIDIGYIDLVVLLGSPKSVTRAIQRIGRSGHSLHDISKGRLMVLDRDDLVESIVLTQNAMAKKLDRIYIPKNPLDVLAQHLVGLSLENRWAVEDAYKLVTSAYSYFTLPYDDFITLLNYLAGNFTMLEERHVYGKLWFDEKAGEFGRRGKMTSAIYYMNSGTIPDEVSCRVYTTDGRLIGKLEEEFVERLLPNDIFVLGGKTYRFIRFRHMSVIAEDATSMKPTIPAWFSEMLPLHYDLARDIAEQREKIAGVISDANGIERLKAMLKIDEKTARSVYSYFMEQHQYGIIPDGMDLLVEEIRSDGLYNYIFHALVGKRANEAIARAAGYAIGEKTGENGSITVSDNGFMYTSKSRLDARLIASIFKRDLEDLLKKALDSSEIINRHFRQVAVRGFLILRRYNGREMSVHRQQFNSQILIKTLKKYMPEFPILKETYREVMEDNMDLSNAVSYWNMVAEGSVKLKYLRDLKIPTPFGFNIYTAGTSDIILMEDKRDFLQKLHMQLVEMIREKGDFHGIERR